MGFAKDQDDRLILHPDCCRRAKSYICAYYNANSIEWEFDNLDVLRDNKPEWYINVDSNLHINDSDRYIKNTSIDICPWCKNSLPDFELNPDAPSDDKIEKVDCNGYYCECGERAGHCTCIRSIVLWRTVKQ
jgi:hypothetical protein